MSVREYGLQKIVENLETACREYKTVIEEKDKQISKLQRRIKEIEGGKFEAREKTNEDIAETGTNIKNIEEGLQAEFEKVLGCRFELIDEVKDEEK